MTAIQTTRGTDESSFAPLFEQAFEGWTIGVDAEGYDHAYYKPAHAVVVYNGEDLDTYQYLGDRPMSDWFAHVEQARGWE